MGRSGFACNLFCRAFPQTVGSGSFASVSQLFRELNFCITNAFPGGLGVFYAPDTFAAPR